MCRAKCPLRETRLTWKATTSKWWRLISGKCCACASANRCKPFHKNASHSKPFSDCNDQERKSTEGVPEWICCHSRTAERREIDAAEPGGGAEDRHRHLEAADYTQSNSGDRYETGRADCVHRYARIARSGFGAGAANDARSSSGHRRDRRAFADGGRKSRRAARRRVAGGKGSPVWRQNNPGAEQG